MNIISLEKFLKKPKCKEFIRIFLFDDEIVLHHIKSKKVVKNLNCVLRENNIMVQYLQNNSSIPIDIIISSNTLGCKSIKARGLNESDIQTLSLNILNEKKNLVNLVCYEKKISYRYGSFSICEANLQPVILAILDQLIEAENPVNSVSTWPLWHIATYFQTYPLDKNKFSAFIFIIEGRTSYNIVGWGSGQIVYSKCVDSEKFDKSSETELVLKCLTRALNVSLENIAISSITAESILTLTESSPVNMMAISRSNTFATLKRHHRINSLIRIAGSALFLLLFTNIISDIVRIFDYKNEIQNNQEELNTISQDLINEIPLWKTVSDYTYDKQVDLRNAIQKEISATPKKLQNISAQIDEKTNEVSLSVLYDK